MVTFHLLDSNAVIDYLKGTEAVIGLIRRLDTQGNTLCACGVVLAEVTAGLPLAARPPAEDFFGALLFLPSTREIARLAGEWRYTYARQGLTVSTADALIAATAHHYDATLVTRNIRHFPMPELRLVSPDVSGG